MLGSGVPQVSTMHACNKSLNEWKPTSFYGVPQLEKFLSRFFCDMILFI